MLARKTLAGILLCTVLPFSALAAATPVAKCFRVYSALLLHQRLRFGGGSYESCDCL